MLYVTTRGTHDAYTAYRTLGEDRAPDGGLFVPFQMPHFSQDEIAEFRSKTFSQTVAEILNLFFNVRMDSWDVEFCIGRYPVRLVTMSHRIFVAEAWHNPDYVFSRIVSNLSCKIRSATDSTVANTDWGWIATRIAILFGIFSELYGSGSADPDTPIDIALPAGDFSGPMAAWYARQMGLPVGEIICCCADSDCLWELLHNGQINTGSATVVPSDMERLIAATLGSDEAKRFISCIEQRRSYQLTEEALEQLGYGLYAAVVSNYRRGNIINRVYKMNTYILDPESAMAFGGLQDYRASVSQTKNAVIIAENCPIRASDVVAKAMSVSVDELRKIMNLN